MERIYLKKKDLEKYENELRISKHLERYYFIRQYCYGAVVDCACGVGYGSYIIQTNPDVQSVIGLDIDLDSIEYAKKEFSTDKTSYFVFDINNDNANLIVDVLVSLETVEHLTDPTKLADLAEKCSAKDLILSYPTKKSTNFNKYHFYDLYLGDVQKIFKNYRIFNKISIANEVDLVMMTRRNDLGISAERTYY